MAGLSFMAHLLSPRPSIRHQNPSHLQHLIHAPKPPDISFMLRSSIPRFNTPIARKSDSCLLRCLSDQRHPSQTEITPSFEPIAKRLSELAVTLIVGALFLAGLLSVRPARACPSQSNVVMEEGGASRSEKKSEEEEMLEKLLEQEPENVDALKMIVNGKMRRGKMKEAVVYVERLIDVQPDEVEWRLLRALCYEIMGQLSKAQKLFKEILKDMPLLVKALHGLAMVMHKKGEDRALFEMLLKALRLASREKRVTEERNIRILIAQMHIVKGRLDEALKRFQELIDDNPRDFRPYLCQGIIYSLQEKEEEAEKQFEIYRSLVPEEFPQRGFLDDVVLAAKKEMTAHRKKDTKAGFQTKSFS